MLHTVPATGMLQKDDKQHYEIALLSSTPYDFQHCEN